MRVSPKIHATSRLVGLLGCFLVVGAVLHAQDPRGTIAGQVMDPSGAVIPGVELTVTGDDTGVATSTVTNSTGSFSVPFLAPGPYTVTAQADGFKRFSRSGIRLRVAEIATLNIEMTLGAISEVVEVTSETPLLETADSSLGQVVDERRIQELPLFAGNPLELIFMTPGIINPGTTMPRQYGPWNNLSVQADGNGGKSNDFTIDGITNSTPEGVNRGSRPAFSPPPSAVSEFKIQTSSFDASVGHTVGMTVNVSTKSGTNQYHGSAYWLVKNSAFDANTFFDNRAGQDTAVYQDNRYGATFGGPIVKNRTFFFVAWEPHKWNIPEPRTTAVPTPLQRDGDFSELLAQGSRFQIYDPFSARVLANGRLERDPLANNIVPQTMMDPVGRNMVQLYPLPNQQGTATGLNNYHTPSVASEDYWTHLGRVDHAFTDNYRMFVRYHIAKWDEDQLRRLGTDNPASGVITGSRDRGIALDNVYVLNATTVINLRYGLTYQERSDHRVSQGWDLAGMGFSSKLAGLIDPARATIPYTRLGEYERISRFWEGDGANSGLTHSLVGNVNKVIGSHNLKFGASLRANRSFGDRSPFATSPYFRFTGNYVRGPLDNSPGSPHGQDLAQMFYGLPSEGSMEQAASFALNGPSLGLYVQDDYKLSPRLTVNLGLRWEHDFAVTERYNRLVEGFAFNQSNPIEAQARANYAANPIDEISVDDFRVLGGLTWVGGSGSRSPFTTGKSNFLPRIGLAFQVNDKTVLRSGFGLFFDTVGINQTVPFQTGFSQTTPVQVSLDDGLSFVTRMSDPLPNGLIAPQGSSGGLTTNLGQSLQFYPSHRRNPYAARWSLGVQRLLPANFVLDVSYVGNRGTKLEIPRELNATPNRYLSADFFRDQATIDHLSERLSNPFAGTDPIYGSTITRADLLKPFPQFGSITMDDGVGYSWYHSLQMRAEKRFSRGYTFQLAYTWSKLMQATEFLNAADLLPYESLSGSDRPHRVSLTGIWELPVGRDRAFGANLPSLANAVLGDWQLGWVMNVQSGSPLEFGDAIFIGNVEDIALPGSERTVERWFNTDAGFVRDSAVQRASNERAFPLRFGGVRGAPQYRWDLSAKKNFHLTEQVRMELRMEAINALNHAIFLPPSTTLTASNFGQVSGTAWLGRNWQFGLKVEF
jgi:hypothetical protein